MATYTKEMIKQAAQGCTTITQVARRLGCCGSKLSGGTANMLRTICPELEGILRGNKEGTSTICPAEGKLFPNDPDEVDNPYRQGSVYALIFKVGSTGGYMTKAAIVEKVAALTGKSTKCIGFSLEVLCRKGHSSNHGSMALRDEDGKKIKLIAVSRNHIH